MMGRLGGLYFILASFGQIQDDEHLFNDVQLTSLIWLWVKNPGHLKTKRFGKRTTVSKTFGRWVFRPANHSSWHSEDGILGLSLDGLAMNKNFSTFDMPGEPIER